MELLQLRYFLAAAHYQHITKAAESLHIAQPAVSQAIHRLEEELGLPLFERESRGIRLNSSGKLLQERLLPLIAAFDAIPEELREAASQKSPVLHLNLLAASSLITDSIIAYRSMKPDIRFKLYQKTDNRTADYCISAVRWETVLKPCESLLLTEDFYLAVPTSSPLSSASSIRLTDTKNESFISLEKSKPICTICDQFCQDAGFIPNIIYESDNPETVRNLIAAGLGIGFWPQYSWGPLTSPLVKLLSIESPICRRKIIASISEESSQIPEIMDFHRFLCQYLSRSDTIFLTES